MACPKVCPKFKHLLIPLSSISCATKWCFIATLSSTHWPIGCAVTSTDNTSSICTSECISPCFSISTFPSRICSGFNVSRNLVSNKTANGSENTPSPFFIEEKSIPVLPPMVASTAPSRVVGT